MIIKRFPKTVFFACMLIVASCAGASYAKSPTVVEVYGKNACSADTQVQDEMFDILQRNNDVILINCRKYYSGENEDHRHTLDFCNERARKYSTQFGYAGVKTPMVIVNGRWDANRKNVEPAVKMGQTDKIYRIELSLNDRSIDMEIPDIKSEKNSGSLFLYVYLPTQGKKKIIVDPDVDVTPELENKIRLKQNVPFVQEVHLTNFYLRPVLAREKIAYWSGGEMSLTYSLGAMTAMAGERDQDISYVVVLHEGGDYGPIIAAGEIISDKEMALSLPKSEPLDIEYISRPTPTPMPLPTQ